MYSGLRWLEDPLWLGSDLGRSSAWKYYIKIPINIKLVIIIEEAGKVLLLHDHRASKQNIEQKKLISTSNEKTLINSEVVSSSPSIIQIPPSTF